MQVKFWGVRGSIATPGPDTVEVGGNTSCVQITCGKTLLVFDAGTGIRLLGKQLLSQMPVEAYVFFSHVHWDHIQGFPFFAPAFIPGNHFHLYGGNDVDHTLEEALAGQMENPSFPVLLCQMGAKMDFHDLREGQELTIPAEPHEPTVSDTNTIRVSNTRGNHPGGVFVYRIDYRGKSVVYCTDTEHYDVVDAKLLRLCADADVLIYDAMYLPEEYCGHAGGPPRTGWGHSTFEQGARLAQQANVHQLVLFHHDPDHDDAVVREKEERCRALMPNTIAAREGSVIDLSFGDLQLR